MSWNARTRYSIRPYRLLAVAVVCAWFALGAHSQSFSCPQVVLSETHSCVVGSCQGQYGVNLCDTTDNTSSFQCVYQTPTCCGKAQVAYQSATEGGACPGSCSSLPPKRPLPRSSTATKQKSIQSGSSAPNQVREAKLSDNNR